MNTLPRHSHPRPGLAIESRHARIATSGQPHCADKRIPLHDERHRRCIAAFRLRLPIPQAISGRHSHAHSRAAARNSVVKMSAPRRRERDIPERLLSEMPALPSGMPGSSRVPVRIRAASIIQQMKRLRTVGSRDLHRKFAKNRVSPMTPHSRIHSTARIRNAIGFHLEKHALKQYPRRIRRFRARNNDDAARPWAMRPSCHSHGSVTRCLTNAN
ncbi:hypothetical protein [Burkholderia ubonensis]|uniref:hypothetical protein n=1 Tax=Burkholderia ubonensis TaxID=101571 RepID=UPI001160B399|nr:hypothetical protein [Burkholderia ubonensis]